MARLQITVLLSVALGAAAGCGDGSKVYPVKGKVTFDGKPMKGGGSVAFMPLGGQTGKTAGGEITEDGNYELMTHKPGDGSMDGEFRVVIIQVTEHEPETVADGEKAVRKKGRSLPAEDRIPTVYGDPYKSPLRATVVKGPNELNFDLARNPAPAKAARPRDPLGDTFAGRGDFPPARRPE